MSACRCTKAAAGAQHPGRPRSRDRIRIGAAGKITSAFDIARTIALGADWCNAGRGFMFALGCIQSLSCHTDKCPTGIATQDPARWKHLDAPDKPPVCTTTTSTRCTP
jgi:glutamate synthase domain-containing protein 2